MHGYQIAETIEARFGRRIVIKTATLYDTLRRLHAEGRVTSRDEQEGNRPRRAVFALTREGEQEFMYLLRESLGTYREPILHGDVGLAFIESLPSRDVRALLTARGESLLAAIEDMLATDVQDEALRVVSSRRAHHLLAESSWLEEVLAGLPDREGGLSGG